MARVSLENLTKNFGKVTAVINLSLDVKDGEFLCILGPSGCGKTTTLRMIAGLEKQDKGNVWIGDKKVNDLSPPERDIAMVFQFYAIYPGATVSENLSFPLQQKKFSKDEIKNKVKETAQLLRIDHLLDQDAMRLTAGEKQRVALGRAYVREPKVFLLDEPLTNLDARLRVIMRGELKRLQKMVGQTTIYVTHDQIEGLTMADRIAVMDQGLLQQCDTPDNLYDKPKSLFVASFIGTPTMNFIDCEFVEKGKKAFLHVHSNYLDITKFKDLIEGKILGDVVLGIRSGDVSLSKDGEKKGVIPAKVEVVELIGDSIIVDLALGDNIIRASSSRSLPIKPDEKLFIKFNIDKIHLFNKKNGKAIL